MKILSGPLTLLLRFFAFMAGFLFVTFEVAATSCYAAPVFPRVMIILDASGSMWGDCAGVTKIEAARSVLADVVPGIPSEATVGLTVYGHRRKGDCKDIEVLYTAENRDRHALLKTVNSLNPKGETPIALSISQVVAQLGDSERETIIILVSDGHETCRKDPCGIVRDLKATGVDFVMHVVGFGVSNSEQQELDCLARAGGGRYFAAHDTASLLAAMQAISKDVGTKVEKARTSVATVSTSLAALKISIPSDALECLNAIKIVRLTDGKLIRTIRDPASESEHPLPAGRYEVIGGYANSNYKADSEMSLGIFQLEGGMTANLPLGALAIDITDELSGMPAGAVIITGKGERQTVLTTPETGNTYYFYRPKPLPAGTYSLAVHYRGSYLYRTGTEPVVLKESVSVQPGKVATAAIDTGIQLQKPSSAGLVAWALVRSGQRDPVMKIEQASNGDYPLWEPYAIASGTYDVLVYSDGMDEPLMVKEQLTISPGSLVRLDTGL